MKSITIKMKDGTDRNFLHEGRSGGSYSKSIRYEGAFAIIKDEWYNEIAIPAENIKEIKIQEHR